MKLIPLLRVLLANVCSLSVALAQNLTDPANHGIVVANMDRSVKPGDDFYRYANGGVKPGDKLYLAPSDRVKIW